MLTMQGTLLPLEKRKTLCDTRNFDKVNYFLPFCLLIMALSMEFTTWFAIKPDITRLKRDLNLQLKTSHQRCSMKKDILKNFENSQENTC